VVNIALYISYQFVTAQYFKETKFSINFFKQLLKCPSISLHNVKPCFCNLTSKLLADEACTHNYHRVFYITVQ
uniref:Uncharacterized protein n=1 Tax=Electrophorus electricus TaxID=8005 RepID=A0AAY5EJR3_ELEEL